VTGRAPECANYPFCPTVPHPGRTFFKKVCTSRRRSCHLGKRILHLDRRTLGSYSSREHHLINSPDCTELATAVYLKVPVTFIIINDSRLDMCEVGMIDLYG
jgi:hypothetical protein